MEFCLHFYEIIPYLLFCIYFRIIWVVEFYIWTIERVETIFLITFPHQLLHVVRLFRGADVEMASDIGKNFWHNLFKKLFFQIEFCTQTYFWHSFDIFWQVLFLAESFCQFFVFSGHFFQQNIVYKNIPDTFLSIFFDFLTEIVLDKHFLRNIFCLYLQNFFTTDYFLDQIEVFWTQITFKWCH